MTHRLLPLALVLLAPLPAQKRAAPPAPAPAPSANIAVWTSADKLPWLEAAVRTFGETFPDRKVELVPMGSLAMQRAALRAAKGTGRLPHVLLPASSLQLDAITAAGVRLAQLPAPLARTYVVVAMWEDAARALGWPDRAVAMPEILQRARESHWRLGHCHPEFSNAGLLAVLLKARALGGIRLAPAETGAGTTTSQPASQPTGPLVDLTSLDQAGDAWRTLEGAQAGYGHSTGFFKDYMVANPDRMQAAFLYENLVVLANKDKPARRLVAVYPSDGTFLVDNPYAIPAGAHQTEETIRTAQLFLQHLLTPNMQQVAMDRGFRPADPAVRLSPLVFAPEMGVSPRDPPLLARPPQDTIREVTLFWRAKVKKKAQVVLVLDVSRSMEGTKMESLQRAAKGLVKVLDDDERVALFTFAREVNLEQELGTVGAGRDQLLKKIDGFKMGGGTHLVEATRRGVEYLDERKDPARTNVVVVMTDGRDPRYRLHEPAFQQMEKAIRSHADVLVFTVGIGNTEEVDPAMLARLATVPSGFTLIGPEGIETVFAEEIRSQF